MILMTNDLAKVESTNSTYIARYGTGEDPYAQFANEGGPGIQGKLATCSKGDWSIGADKTPVKAGTQFLFIVPETMRGWLKWEDGAVSDAVMGYVRDGFLVQHRGTLGDDDETAWQKNPEGTPRDPWTRTYRALLLEMSPPHGDVTFSGSSFGAQIALKEICRVYSADNHRFPDAFPVVELTTKTRQHKTYGSIKGPWFNIVGWATVEDVKAGKKGGAKAKAPTKVETEAELNDELPGDWA
jgi:hypothetical protein